MKKLKFDRNLNYPFITYLRMSTEGQNPRSPDQQQATIDNEITRQALTWIEIGSYRDAGITGKVKLKRPGFAQMMSDIKSGTIKPQLILVDTIERLGRSEDTALIIQYFWRIGILVLDAKSQFADPTTSQGKLLTMLETWRGFQESEIKGHMVRRGKRDSVERGFWPGGPPPMGYKLVTAEIERRAGREKIYNRIAPDPETRHVVERVFELADVLGYGATKIARTLNAELTIPASLKPFQPNSVNHILSNPIYQGVMVWGRNSADYEDDVRVLTANPCEDWQTVANFCEPIVDRDRWDRVQILKNERAKAARAGQDYQVLKSTTGCRGIPLKYPLSGLVNCETCGRSMVVSKHNTTHNHPGSPPAYRCPTVKTGACSNRSYVDLKWLLDTVVDLMVNRLFFQTDIQISQITPEAIQESKLFQVFLDLVEGEVRRRQSIAPTEVESLKAEQKSLRDLQTGWTTSLGNPKLPDSLRSALESKYAESVGRLDEIHRALAQIENTRKALFLNCCPKKIAELLTQLSTVLAKENASASNLELSRHIDRITVTEDGKVVIRMCKLGFLVNPAAMKLLSSRTDDNRDGTCDKPVRPRRLIESGDEKPWELSLRSDYSIDPHRFDHLSEEWFWTDELSIPYKKCWSEQHALAVAHSRLAEPCGLETLAKRFGVSKPTIETALQNAKTLGVDATEIDGRQLHRNWAKDNARDVAEYFRQPGATMPEAIKRFGKSDAWIRKSRKYGEQELNGKDV